MARATGAQAAAIRRRIKHERRIADKVNPLDRLRLTMAWLLAEANRVPHLLDQVTGRVHQTAADLNDLEAQPGKETPQ